MTLFLPKLVPRLEVRRRLELAFSPGFEYRANVVNEVCASTVFVSLYIGAVEGSDPKSLLAPKHVYRMTNEQSVKSSDAERIDYALECIKSGYESIGKKNWYADTTKEQIRDNCLRFGLVAGGAAIIAPEIKTTSMLGRYSLRSDFAELFSPDLTEEQLGAAIKAWQKAHLSKGALAKIKLDTSLGDFAVNVEFPGIGSRQLGPGPSSIISKSVVEEFAIRFLKKPKVLWLSESGNKVVVQDQVLAQKIGLKIDASKNLPDIILVELGLPEILLVFVEVVATDGPVSEIRRSELMKLVSDAGLSESHAAFVTAFMDRSAPGLKKSLPMLAWNSFVWLAADPDKIIALIAQNVAEKTPRLHALLRLDEGA